MAGPYYVKAGSGTAGTGTFRGEFATTTTYAVGDRVVPTRAYATAGAKGFIYECTTTGLTGASQPTWVFTTPGTSTTTSGTATFTCRDCTTWANANVYSDYQIGNRLAAGETIYRAADTETASVDLTLQFPNNVALPCNYIVVSDTGEPPTTPSTSGVLTTTGASDINLYGSYKICGMTFNCGTGATSANINFNTTVLSHQQLNDCNLNLLTTSTNSRIALASAATLSSKMVFKNVNCSVANVSQNISLNSTNFSWQGGGITGATIPTALLDGVSSTKPMTATLKGVDLSALTSGKSLVALTNVSSGNIRFVDCKLGSGVSETTGTPAVRSFLVALENSTSTSANYTFSYTTYEGNVREETTIVKTGGASNGTTPYSMLFSSNGNASFLGGALDGVNLPPRWNSVLAPITVTVDILHDSVTDLNDDDIYVEVEYLSDSGFPISTFISSAKANILSAGSPLASSAATWTTTGLTNPNAQKMSVAFTPEMVGYIQAKVYLAIPNYDAYVDAVLQIQVV